MWGSGACGELWKPVRKTFYVLKKKKKNHVFRRRGEVSREDDVLGAAGVGSERPGAQGLPALGAEQEPLDELRAPAGPC